MEHYLPAHYIELFHLYFLQQLGLKMDTKLYAVKGGCNLRFFLKSIRYSQDMDIDVQIIQKETLQNHVRKILASTNFKRTLSAAKIEILTISEPKQTETTQRWKILLKVPQSSVPLNTKIEFSRRGLKGDVQLDSIDPIIASTYRLSPIYAVHYTMEEAILQKVKALVGRNETQSRDVFDLFHLMTLGARIPKLPVDEVEKAQLNALSISYEAYKSQVIAYLPREYHQQYDSVEFWEQLVLKVIEELENEAD